MIQALKTVLPIKRTEQQKEQRIFKKMYFQRSRRKEAGRISSQEPESAGKIDGSTFG